MTTEIRTNRPSRRQQWMWLGLIGALAILAYQLSGLIARPGVPADDYVEHMQVQR
jgi:hypothetical protein